MNIMFTLATKAGITAGGADRSHTVVRAEALSTDAAGAPSRGRPGICLFEVARIEACSNDG